MQKEIKHLNKWEINCFREKISFTDSISPINFHLSSFSLSLVQKKLSDMRSALILSSLKAL